MTDHGPNVAQSIPFYVIRSALERAKENDRFAVIRSDNDFQFARTLPEANDVAAEMRSEIYTMSPIEHTVQVIKLQKEPPEADDAA